ncbi:hypothetical protein Tco_0005015 [Tanacetum coccineum]
MMVSCYLGLAVFHSCFTGSGISRGDKCSVKIRNIIVIDGIIGSSFMEPLDQFRPETDKVNHTMEMDMLKLVVEVECFGKCVMSLIRVVCYLLRMHYSKRIRVHFMHSNELHLHVVLVVPSAER